MGGGPAGLRAAEIALEAGASVTLFEGKPSVGRKFLIAGHGGLNLTHSDKIETFASRYSGGIPNEIWVSLLNDFSNQDMRIWASKLGVDTFIGSSGRIFPREMKAATLLLMWIRRLNSLGISLKTSHLLKHIELKDGRFVLTFLTLEGEVLAESDAVILALGGASWPDTGSEANWLSLISSFGIPIKPLEPANCGWEVNWSLVNKDAIFKEIEGKPLKNIRVTAEGKTILGELLITKYGLEGGALYQLGNILRSMKEPKLYIDLKPSFSKQELEEKIKDYSNDLIKDITKAWRLTPAALFLLRCFTPGTNDRLTICNSAKNLLIPLVRPRPIAEAISSAGGVSFDCLDEYLMIKTLPGLFFAGEMLDWEAPTGGYLLQGCFSTGTRAAHGAIRFMSHIQKT